MRFPCNGGMALRQGAVALPGRAGMTITAWLNPTTQKNGSSGRMPVFSFGSSASGAASGSSPWTAMYFNASTSTLLVEAALDTSSSQTLVVCTNTGISLGQYAHVGVTMQKACTPLSTCTAPVSFAVYVNGALLPSCNAAISKSFSTIGAAWRTSAFLGQSQSTMDGRYAGYIGDMQARALSAMHMRVHFALADNECPLGTDIPGKEAVRARHERHLQRPGPSLQHAATAAAVTGGLRSDLRQCGAVTASLRQQHCNQQHLLLQRSQKRLRGKGGHGGHALHHRRVRVLLLRLSGRV